MEFPTVIINEQSIIFLCLCMTIITQKRNTKTMADVGQQSFTKSVFFYPTPYCKIIRKFPLSIALMLISLNLCLNDDEKKNRI